MAELKIVIHGLCRPCPGAGGCEVGYYRAHTQNWARADVRTPMYGLGENGHFCPTAPISRAPAGILGLLHNSCGPNSDKTASKN